MSGLLCQDCGMLLSIGGHRHECPAPPPSRAVNYAELKAAAIAVVDGLRNCKSHDELSIFESDDAVQRLRILVGRPPL